MNNDNNVTTDYRCTHTECGRTFHSPVALRMHVIRTHGRGWSTVRNLKNPTGRKRLTPKERKANKARRNAEMRARYRARGLTSQGKPRKRHPRFPSEASAVRKQKYQEQRDRYYEQGLSAKGQPIKRGNHRMRHFVYPVPTPPITTVPPGFLNPDMEPRHTMKHCPECGCPIGRWKFE